MFLVKFIHHLFSSTDYIMADYPCNSFHGVARYRDRSTTRARTPIENRIRLMRHRTPMLLAYCIERPCVITLLLENRAHDAAVHTEGCAVGRRRQRTGDERHERCHFVSGSKPL